MAGSEPANQDHRPAPDSGRRGLGRWLPLGVVALALILFGYALWRGKVEPTATMIGRTPDAVQLAVLTPEGVGASSSLALRGPAIVNFWASWCTPCRVEHPLVKQLAESAGVPVYGLAYRDTPEAAASYLAELGNPYAQVHLDPDGQAAIAYGLRGVPETFVIDANGAIVAHLGTGLTPQNIKGTIIPALERAKTMVPQ